MRHTDRVRPTKMDRQTDTERGDRVRHMRQTDRQTDRVRPSKMDRQTDRDMRQTDRIR